MRNKGMKQTLKEGFTTGTATSAAAMCAVRLLFSLDCEGNPSIPLPPFTLSDTGGFVTDRYLSVPIASFGQQDDFFWAKVVKDGGDDPDATNGLEITVCAAFRPFQHSSCKTILLPAEGKRIYLQAGKGIGTVTLPGLPVAPGEPAVNPEPRKQIAAAVASVLPSSYNKPIYLLVDIPQGEERAGKTLNPRLGIVGGISILGTHGTVKPYSHAAFTASIHQGVNVAQALSLNTVLLSTGRRSERLLFSLYPQCSPQSGIQVADYAAFAVSDVCSRTFSHVVWGCFPGKLVKLAQGMEWTHASQGLPDIPLLYRLWQEAGGQELEAIASVPTAAGAFAIMEAANPVLYAKILNTIADKALAVLVAWAERACIKEHSFLMTLEGFSMDGEHLVHKEYLFSPALRL